MSDSDDTIIARPFTSEPLEEVEEYEPGDPAQGLPQECKVEVLPSPAFQNMPLARPSEPLQVPGGTLIMETEVKCMHCGANLGEFRNGQRIMIQHPPLVEGMPPFGIWLLEEDTKAGAQHIGRKIGVWVNAIHSPERTIHPPEEEQHTSRVIPLRPETRRFKNVVADEHTQRAIIEVIGDAVKQIAGLIHMMKFPGAGEQMVVDLSDDCAFHGQIIMRVIKECTHESKVHEQDGIRGTENTSTDQPENESSSDNPERTPEEQLLRAIFRDFEQRQRDGGTDDTPGTETYSHDSADPAHDD